MAPFVKAGGLADVAGALPEALLGYGVDSSVFLPLYGDIDRDRHGIEPLPGNDDLEVADGRYGLTAALYHTKTDAGLPIYFIRQDRYFDRPGIYTVPGSGTAWPDDDERFFFFQQAVLAGIEALRLQPDLLHLNDYHTALIPLLLRERVHPPVGEDRVRTLLTIHNLGYQGVYPPGSALRAGLDLSWVAPLAPLEFHGRLNLLKAGIHYADHINTVSPAYADEILTAAQGFGLEGMLNERREDVSGIINGIDTDGWDPATDPHLPENYSAADLSGKAADKAALQREVGLETGAAPLVGIVSRLVHQKGCDLLLQGLGRLLAAGLQLVILGTGEKQYEEALAAAAAKHPRHIAFKATFDNALAHRIEAGADLFLMPSRYEPCGLNQLYSLRYGTVPVVAATGGLRDTVREWNSGSGTGNGFLFAGPKVETMLAALNRAVQVYGDRNQWRQIQLNGMQEDHSWSNSAREYRELYERMVYHKTAEGTRK